MSAPLLRQLLSESGRSDPYPIYRRLHELGPVVALPADSRYAAIVHGYHAVGQVLRDPNFRVLDAEYLDRTSTRWRAHGAVRTMQNSMFHAGGEKLARIRRVFGQTFSAARTAALEPMIDRRTDQLLDRLATLGTDGAPVDFMADFALRLPSDVIGELLGIPEPDRAGFPNRVKAFDAILEVGQRSFRELRAADAAAEELTAYFAAVLAERRTHPGDDLISALAEADTPLEEPELLANLIVVFNAAFRTTANLLGNGLRLLLAHPDTLAALRADAPAYVEEILRFDPPVHFANRFAVRDTEVAGVPVPAGRSVLILTGAANRDPDRFPDPDRFDPTRTDNHHYGFSAGPHYCLGASLGRAEGRLALPRLLSRFPSIALAAEPPARRDFMLRGYPRLDVRLTTGTRREASTMAQDTAVGLYRTVRLIRRFEERAIELVRTGEIIGGIHPYLGQEAIAAGVCAALRVDDIIASTHRGHGHVLAKGADPARMLAELAGRATGLNGGRGGSMHAADFTLGIFGANAIVGANSPIVVGAAWAAQQSTSDRVAVSFFGDGAVSQGVLLESMNLAALWRLPVLFVCENNGYATTLTVADSVAGTITGRGEAFGIPSVTVDGMDPLTVLDATRDAVSRARSGGGPTLIECVTYRFGAHHTWEHKAGVRYRDDDEVHRGRSRDPLLIQGDRLSEADRARIDAEIEAVLDDAVAFALASPHPDPADALDHLYATGLRARSGGDV